MRSTEQPQGGDGASEEAGAGRRQKQGWVPTGIFQVRQGGAECSAAFWDIDVVWGCMVPVCGMLGLCGPNTGWLGVWE